MIRKLLTVALPFLAPFLVYLIYWWTTQRRKLAEAHGREVSPWEDFPWVWTMSAGATLTALVLVVMAIIPGDAPTEAYRTPRFEDGKIVPGNPRQ